MRVLQPFYYKDFKCIGGECKFTCCAKWSIYIDKKSYFKYKKVNGEFGNKLKKSLKRNRKNPADYNYGQFILNEQGRCPLLNDENLCSLYINEGENYLCDVCKIYPREGYIYKNIIEKSLSTTCPEIAKKLVFTKEKFSFDMNEEDMSQEEKSKYSDLSLKNNDELFNMLYEARNLSIDIAQLEGVPIWKRLIFIEFLGTRMQKLIDSKSIKNYPATLIEFMKAMENYICDNSINKVNKFIKFQIISMILKEDDGIYDEAVEKLNNMVGGKTREEVSDILEVQENEFNEYFKDREYIYENYLVYNLYSNYMKSFADENIHRQVVTTILDYGVFKLLLLAFWFENKSLDNDTIVMIIYKFTRHMEHSHLLLKKIYKWMQKNKLDTNGYLVTIAY